MVAEGRGVGPWIGKEDDVPRLENQKQLFNLIAMRSDERGTYGHGYRIDQQRGSSEEGVEFQRVTPLSKN